MRKSPGFWGKWKRSNLRLFSYLIIVYMILAFGWWAVLLHNMNEDAFRAKLDTLRISRAVDGDYLDEQSFRETAEYRELQEKYEQQETMIIGEAAVIILSLVVGLWMINRGYSTLFAAEKSKRNFLLSVSHELKSPIASIKLALQTMQQRNLNQEQLRDTAQKGIEESERLHRLVNNILLATRMETGYTSDTRRTDIARLAAETVDTIRRQYPGAEIVLQIEQGLTEVDIDRTALESVLINLIENAVKYSPDDPQVRVEIIKNDSLNIRVADQGVGIPPAERQKIFDKFYRVGSENTRISKGTGLGLYIVDHLVKTSGGSIRITDNEPRGTVVLVNLPVDN